MVYHINAAELKLPYHDQVGHKRAVIMLIWGNTISFLKHLKTTLLKSV